MEAVTSPPASAQAVCCQQPRLKEYWALTSDKEALWKKWFEIATQHSLADGEYLNLYDLAFDFPEAHAIRKADKMYYAFFTHSMDENYVGELQFRGLDEAQKYQIQDYVEGRILGEVAGSDPHLRVEMCGALLLCVTKMEANK